MLHSGIEWNTALIWRLVLAFVVWHLFVYPASNAYNSYQDQDTGPIGDIKHPLPADRSVFYLSLALNFVGLLLAVGVSLSFALYVLVYIAASQLYSFRKVRLKKYPIPGFLVIFVFQGFWVFISVTSLLPSSAVDWPFMLMLGLSTSFLFGGGYPITQVYQHKQDREDGVETISMLLGVRGTLMFSAIMNLLGWLILGYYLVQSRGWADLGIYATLMLPSLIFFNSWLMRVLKDAAEANFENVMKMSWLSALCNNLAILVLVFRSIISG